MTLPCVSRVTKLQMSDPNYSNSTYGRRNVSVKIMRVSGGVSGFQQSAARNFADSLALEIESAARDFREVSEFAAVWGVADENVGFTGDSYQYNGIYPWILKDDPTNCVFDIRGAKITLADLDDALDITVNKWKGLGGGRWFWLMSPGMITTVSGLQTLIQRQVQQIEFEGGFKMSTYMGIPIIPSGFLCPSSTSASVAGLGTTAAGSGSVAAGTYYYRVAAITLYGEQVTSAGNQVNHTGSEAQTNLSWTANSDAKLYAIYRGSKNGDDTVSDYDLIDIIAAKAYNSDGEVTGNVTTYTDDFSKTAKANVHPLSTYDSTSRAMENIFLVYLDQAYGMSLAILPPAIGDPYGGDPELNSVRYREISVATDSYAFALQNYSVLQIPDAKVCVAIRGAQKNATA